MIPAAFALRPLYVRDLTDARLAQEALEESEHRFMDFAEVADDWLWELDESLRFVYLSARFEAIMGHAAGAGSGSPPSGVISTRRIMRAATTRSHHLDLAQRLPFDGLPVHTYSRRRQQTQLSA